MPLQQSPHAFLFFPKAKGVGEEVRGRLSGLTNLMPEPHLTLEGILSKVKGTSVT